MINGYEDDVYLICPRCRKAFPAWDGDCWMQDDYIEGSEETDDPLDFLYQTTDYGTCPLCRYEFDLYGHHTPGKFTITGKTGTCVMSLAEASMPPTSKKLFSVPGGLFAAPEKKLFALRNAKHDRGRMRVCPNPRKGQRRWERRYS